MPASISLHNVAETLELSTGQRTTVPRDELALPAENVQLQRVPEAVRQTLNQGAQAKMLDSSAMEIRFVADGPVQVTLSKAQADEGKGAEVYAGDFKHGWAPTLLGPEPTTMRIEPPPQIQALLTRLAEGGPGAAMIRQIDWVFHPAVTRVLLPTHGGPVCLHSVEPEPGVSCRAPRRDELPARRMLAYGTSITHGAASSSPSLTYAALTACRLRADLINLGSGGSAHCEPELADYIASRDDWDFATLALSVNMRGFEQEAFRQRVGYMVQAVAAAHPAKPVFAITLWPFWGDLGFDRSDWNQPDDCRPEQAAAHAQRMRQDLRDMAAEANLPNLHLLEGPDLFGPVSGLTTDLIHPGDLGMIRMAENLSDRIEPHLQR